METEATLSELQSLLYRWNYAVFLHSYRLPLIPGAAAQDYIVQALPDAEIGGTQSVSGQVMLDEVEQSLRYAGDTGSGPKSTALNSPKFEELFAVVRSGSVALETSVIRSNRYNLLLAQEWTSRLSGFLGLCLCHNWGAKCRGIHRLKLRLKHPNIGTTRRCTRPPTASLVPRCASGGG